MKLKESIFLSLCYTATAQMYQKVKLKDVNTLTLYQGRMTNARRSSPIPQLQCRGGSAGCTGYVPDVVQCYNRGSDGLDIQWECKTDMPFEYKFGKVQVSCEGYDYPEDNYVLAGSCGLEYTIDRTGVNDSQQKTGSSYSSNGWNGAKTYKDSDDTSNAGLIVFFCIIGFIIYKAFLGNSTENPPPYNPDYIPPAGTMPPPYSHSSSGCPPGRQNSYWGKFASFGAGWAANSFFGGRGWNRGYTSTVHEPRPRSPRRSPSPNRSSSSGTRTASGFGGTSRR